MTIVQELKSLPLKVVLSYVVDWIAIIALLMIAVGINEVTPNYHAFSVLDTSISYPYREETVSNGVLITVSLIIPGIIIPLVCLLLAPSHIAKGESKVLRWRSRIWEWNVGWMGLGLGWGITMLLTNALKNLTGKPRPDLLSRCDPDIANLSRYVVGGYGQDISPRWTLVTQEVCRPAPDADLTGGFRSFPSGHASFSFLGMTYLSLFLCAKLGVAFPFIPLSSRFRSFSETAGASTEGQPTSATGTATSTAPFPPTLKSRSYAPTSSTDPVVPLHARTAATPPAYLLFAPFFLMGVAIFIASTRYFNYRHFGIDIFAGSVIGFGSALFAFRWFYMPLRQDTGAAWGPRSSNRAFWAGPGRGHVAEEAAVRGGGLGQSHGGLREREVELGDLEEGRKDEEIDVGRGARKPDGVANSIEGRTL